MAFEAPKHGGSHVPSKQLWEADEDTKVQSSSEAGQDLTLPLSRPVHTTELSSPSYLRAGKKDRGAIC